MATKGDDPRNDPKLENERGLNRRDFVRTGVAAGLGAGALLEPDEAQAQVSATGAQEVVWDYEVDVVIAGGGCAGLTAAIRARDLGASVLVVDQNFDLGGRMLHSGSLVSLGGGDPVQLRDMKGESDHEGLVTVDPFENPEELDDNIELLFDAAFQHDPLRLLQGVSRNRTIVATWNGTLQNGYLSYAVPDHPEFRRYSGAARGDVVVVRPDASGR